MEERRTLHFEKLNRRRPRTRLRRYGIPFLLAGTLAIVGALAAYMYRDRVTEWVRTVENNVSSTMEGP